MQHSKQLQDATLTPFQLFASATVIGSFAGITRLLNSNQKITSRTAVAATMHSGVAALIIALLWHNTYGETNPFFLLGICGLAGIGAVNILDIGAMVIQKTLPIALAIVAKNGQQISTTPTDVSDDTRS